jgi:hypothetical protein
MLGNISARKEFVSENVAVRTRRVKVAGDSKRVKIAKHIAEFGPITTFEVNAKLGFGLKTTQCQVSLMVKRCHVVRTGRKRLVGTRHLTLYKATDAGILYVEQL